jgi:hypothetical protein
MIESEKVFKNIDEARDNAYENIVGFLQREEAGTLALLYKNGFGKSTLQSRIFEENEDVIMLAQSHKHIEEVLLKKLEEIGLKEDIDYVYVQPMEMKCSRYDELRKSNDPEDIKTIQKNKILNPLRMPAGQRHSEIIQCTDPDCPYILQQWAINKNNPDRIQKVVSTVRMYLNKNLQYNYSKVIIDEIDGLMEPEPHKIPDLTELSKHIGDVTIHLGEYGQFMSFPHRKIKDRKNWMQKMEALRETMRENVKQGIYDPDILSHAKNLNILTEICHDGVLVTNGTTDDDNWFNVNKGKNGETCK